MRIQSRLSVGVAALVLAPTLAFSHSSKQGTTPADGAALDGPPAAIEMTFDKPLRVTLVELTDAAGESYPLDYARGETTRTFTAEPAELPPGDYTVEWRGLSKDGHPTTGSFSFTID